MLMILPLLSRSEIDYSAEYGLRQLFWLGRSSCTDPDGFFCNRQPTWVTKEGWIENLRAFNQSALDSNLIFKKELLWLYVPNFEKEGNIESLTFIPGREDIGLVDWHQSEHCAGFNVSDNCPWRYEEMELIRYTPSECLSQGKHMGCEELVTYARFQMQLEI